MTRLQSVLCAAARLIIQVPSHAPVSGVMRDVLHWLSFPQRVSFKLCLLTYKCLHGLAPQYLSVSRCCIPLAAVPGRSQLRSADEGHLLVPRTSTSTLGPRAFYSFGPASWNSLRSTDGTSTPGLDSRRLQAAVEDSFIFVDVGLWTFSPRAPI